ncbi:MAG: 4-hydroxy-2-oxovalerate aldolase [Desulfobacterales bacterium]|nr:4-hydroxy-2-oxovalerate aldolase [Desulfobacterales bacterium]
MLNQCHSRAALKKKFQNRERVFGGWVSYAHPSITETIAMAGFDFIAIDMEHSTISVEQAQRIIAACQGEGTLCLPRPVSHSNDWIKPLLESGADGLIIQMVNTAEDVKNLLSNIKYPPKGCRSFGVNRAQGYGFDFDSYVKGWNESSTFIIQVESINAVQNINELISFEDVDSVMVGPYDISGSLGVPGQLKHPDVIKASKRVIDACARKGKSCGTQLAEATEENVKQLFDLGYTYAILSSDLFVLWKWAESMKTLIHSMKCKDENK